MKNNFKLYAFIIFTMVFCGAVNAQQSSVSLNKKGVSVIFKIETSSPEAKKQSFGSVYFTGYDERENESRVHRVLADRESGLYLGYDLVIESSDAPNKFKVSIRPLSVVPPENLRLSDLTLRSLPKYPEALIVEDGDTISLDLLFNPQTNVKISDLIKITTKQPQINGNYTFTTSAGSGGGSGSGNSSGSGGGSRSGSYTISGGTSTSISGSGRVSVGQSGRDFSLDDVKLRLTSPKLFINGAIGGFRGSEWDGIIEGSVIYIFVPGKGRYIFSLFPRDNYRFQKYALLQNGKISFQMDGENYELVSDAPIVNSSNGEWNLFVLRDADFKPDLTLGANSDFVQYGAAENVESLMTKSSKRMISGGATGQRDNKAIYQKWLDEDVKYIVSNDERQSFLELNTDQEREQFIEAFWQKRDTKPETRENEFRREYYGRIAQANENFGFGKISGWKTDRGRIYISYGRPDEIKKSEAGEIWTYRFLPDLGSDVKFEFVKTDAREDFRLKQ